jgi:hypothetical protein
MQPPAPAAYSQALPSSSAGVVILSGNTPWGLALRLRVHRASNARDKYSSKIVSLRERETNQSGTGELALHRQATCCTTVPAHPQQHHRLKASPSCTSIHPSGVHAQRATHNTAVDCSAPPPKSARDHYFFHGLAPAAACCLCRFMPNSASSSSAIG